LAIAASSMWWFGWFDKKPSPEEIRAEYDRQRSHTSTGARRPADRAGNPRSSEDLAKKSRPPGRASDA